MGDAPATRRRSVGRGDSKGAGSDVAWDSSTNNNANANNNNKKPVPSNKRPTTRATSRRSSAGGGGGGGGNLKQRTGGGGVGGGKAAPGRASGRSGGDDMGVPAVATASAGVRGAGEDEAKLTRAEWQSLQADETISFALNYVKQRAVVNPQQQQQQQTTPLCEKPGDREAVVAALTVLKAAHHATSFAEQAAASAAGGGAGESEERGLPTAAAAVRFADDKEALLDWDSQRGGRDVMGLNLNPADYCSNVQLGRSGGGQRGRVEVEEGLEMVAGLLLVLAKGYQHLTQFRCREVRASEKKRERHRGGRGGWSVGQTEISRIFLVRTNTGRWKMFFTVQ